MPFLLVPSGDLHVTFRCSLCLKRVLATASSLYWQYSRRGSPFLFPVACPNCPMTSSFPMEFTPTTALKSPRTRIMFFLERSL